MIDCLYKPFRQWSAFGSVFIYSDPHFEDTDCKIMNADWPEPNDQLMTLSSTAHKNDTLVVLGDIGKPAYFQYIKAHKVLICGNHDAGVVNYAPYFDEIYTGPLMISDKILLSHEPVLGLPFVLNIHGHCHNGEKFFRDENGGLHMNVCSDVIGWQPLNLGYLIKHGLLSEIPSIHRITIEKAKENHIYKKEIS